MGPKKDAWTAAGPPAVHMAVLPATELRHGHTCIKPVTIPAGTRTCPVRKGKMGLFKHKQCCLIKTTVSLLDKPIPKTEGQELPASEVRWKHLTLTAPTPENRCLQHLQDTLKSCFHQIPRLLWLCSPSRSYLTCLLFSFLTALLRGSSHTTQFINFKLYNLMVWGIFRGAHPKHSQF